MSGATSLQVVRYIRTYIPSARVYTLGSDPLLIVPSPGSDFFIQLLSISGQPINGSNAYDTPDIRAYTKSDAVYQGKEARALTMPDKFCIGSINAIDGELLAGTDLYLRLANGINPTVGDYDYWSYITYAVMPA